MTKEELQQWAKEELRRRNPEFVRNLEAQQKEKEQKQKQEETQKGLEGKITEVKNEIAPIKDELTAIKEPTERMAKFLDLLKGDVGEKGERGETGESGKDGKDGINGINGKDGKPGRSGKDGIDGKDGKSGKPGKDGKDGKDGKGIETIKIIRDVITKLKTLPETEKLDISHLRNSQQIISAISKMNKPSEEKKLGKFDMSDQRWHGGGGGAPIEEEPTGDINGANTTFTITAATTHHIYHNGIRLRSGAGNDYTISGTTLTMLWAPESGTLIHEYWT